MSALRFSGIKALAFRLISSLKIYLQSLSNREIMKTLIICLLFASLLCLTMAQDDGQSPQPVIFIGDPSKAGRAGSGK